MEVCKCNELSHKNIHNYEGDEAMTTRSISTGVLMEAKVSNTSDKTFLNDATHIWNKAPLAIKECTSITQVKKAIELLSFRYRSEKSVTMQFLI